MPKSVWNSLLRELKSQDWYRGQITHIEVLPARGAIYSEPQIAIHHRVRTALQRAGIQRLYQHQADAIAAIRAGKHVAIITGASSGKTLCYNIPVLEALLTQREMRALYIFPTKALAQDQLRKLRELGLFEHIIAWTYDGDTPVSERRTVRETCPLIFTNPDMLHLAILPNHHLWRRFLANLRFVVLDELHTYHGIFGMHVASIIRRLRRLCKLYGSSPQFICASATLANPHELTQQLLGVPCHIVADDTAPSQGKTFVFWNPPIAMAADEWRVRPNTEATRLLMFLMERGIRTIVFTRARVTAEVILQYVRSSFAKNESPLAEKIMAYRAGYLPEQRREIERRLFDGDLLAVVATTALELGIDIGDLDAAILVGYPGSIASTFQQAGRVGRVEEGLVFLIASSNPVDQYVLHHPEYLFSKGAEPTIVNANNRYITAAHLLCAAHEHPLSDDDTNYFGESVMEIANQLSGAGYLTKVAIHDGDEFYKDSSTGAQRTHYLWAGSERPHDAVGIRTITGRNYEIRDLSQGEALLGTVDEDRAFATVYEGAIYLHAGNTYRVRRLDIPNRVAYVEPVNVDEYTLPLRHTDVTIQSTICDESLPKADAAYGELNVSQQVFAYKRLRLFTEQVIEICPLELPPQEFDTIGLWLLPAFEITELLESKGMNVMGALHAAEHALTALMPLVTLCDIHDIAGVSYGVHPQIGRPAIFIYDVYPGGAGFAESAFERLNELLMRTVELVERCPCADGCPSCVQSPSCGNNNQPLDKVGSIVLLKMMLGTHPTRRKRNRKAHTTQPVR